MKFNSLHMSPRFAYPAKQRLLSVGKQSGVSLLISLIFLVVLTLLGITAMKTGILEERMAGNARDRNLAFQAAEAALRDAEKDTRCRAADGITPTLPANLRSTGCISGMTGADASCTAGLCCTLSAPGMSCVEPATPVDLNTSLSLSAAPSVKYGDRTGAAAITYTATSTAAAAAIPLPTQPRYLIEPFQKGSPPQNYYRITARGYGANQFTQVTLQEIYKE